MNITPDTNVLVRMFLWDDPAQYRLAIEAVGTAQTITLTLPALCEFVWVMIRGYRYSRLETAAAIRELVESANVRVERAAVEAGLAMLEGGGDFADGIIAFEGRRLGGEEFTSFDRQAVRLIELSGGRANLLG